MPNIASPMASTIHLDERGLLPAPPGEAGGKGVAGGLGDVEAVERQPPHRVHGVGQRTFWVSASIHR